MHQAGRTRLIEDLRGRIERLEGPAPRARGILPFGVPEVDAHLPGGGLAVGALHEVLESDREGDHAALAALFVAGILGRRPGPVLWCLARRDLFAPALACVGLHPDRVIYAETWRARDVAPVMEEGLRHRGLAGVVGETVGVGLTASRRLLLAAEAAGSLAFVIRRRRDGVAEATAALTRWRIGPAPSRPLPAPGLGRERWLVELVRCRGAEPRSWLLESPDAQGRLAPPRDLADRPHPPRLPRRAAAG